jgi:hypothetical protein
VAATAVIVEEVERLHWRLWNGEAKDAQISIDRIRVVLPHFRAHKASGSPSRPHENYGPPCTRWMAISPARVIGWSTTPSGTESRIVSCYCDHRRDRQFSGEPPDEQVAYVDGPLLARYFAVF